MTKNELKSALTLAGVPFAKKANLETLQSLFDALDVVTQDIVAPIEANVDDLIGNLLLVENGLPPVEGTFGAAELAVADGSPESHAAALRNLEAAHLERVAAFTVPEDADLSDLHCPHCNITLDNGLLHVTDCAANTNESYFAQRDPAFEAGEWMCMGCGGHFGAPVEYPVQQVGLKIEKDRPEANGVKRPSIGGKCRAIWDALDAFREETGELPTSKTVKALAADEGWNPNNASIEYYQWRKFNGIAKGA